MKILTDDITIFEILSAAKMENFDPLKKSVFAFSSAESWHLLLFNPSGNLKGCRLYVLGKDNFEKELQEKLLPELLLLNDNHDYVILKNEALLIVETLIGNQKGKPLFFDAH